MFSSLLALSVVVAPAVAASPSAVTPAEAVAANAATPPADDPLVCRNERKTGSRMTHRVCRPRSYLIAERKAAEAEAERALNARPVAQDLENLNIRPPGH